MKFDDVKFDRSTVPAKIVDEIKVLIETKKLKLGEKLPSERELSQRFNVSRNTIRESYKILSTLGYIEIKHGHGVFVATGSNNLAQLANQYFIRADQFRDLFEIRGLIETQVVVWTVERAADAKVDELYQFVTETIELIKAKAIDVRILSQRDHRFHMEIAALSNNALAYRMMDSLTSLFADVRKEASKIPNRVSDSWVEHLQIAEMIKKRNALEAKKCMEEHLKSVEKTLSEEWRSGR